MKPMVFKLEKINIKNSTRQNKKMSEKIDMLFEVESRTMYGSKQEWFFEDGEKLKTSELQQDGVVKLGKTKEGIKVLLIMANESYELLYLENKKIKIKQKEQLSFI